MARRRGASWFAPCCLALLLLASAGPAAALQGVVVDARGRPLAGAEVRYQGSAQSSLSDAGGRFRLVPADGESSRQVTAWKRGYYNGGVVLKPERRHYRIVLQALPSRDYAHYRWLSPRGPVHAGSGKPCATCHTPELIPLMAEWAGSSHAGAATNPFFLGLFRGDEELQLVEGLGYRRDFPGANGNCANCHVPALALRRPYAADPTQAQGVEREGIFCDFCHKVQEARADPNGGRPGVLSLNMLRPAPHQQVFFGPYADAVAGPDSYNPLYRDSRYCAACHDGRFWGVQVYGEFAEWQASPYPARKISCQSCHMKPDGRSTRVAPAQEGSILRAPATIASHAFSGRENLDFMRSAVKMQVETELERDKAMLNVRVVLRNSGAGHHLPSGNPMRNLILLVEAKDSAGQPLPQLGGSRVPAWGGEGDPDKGNYAGLPGKGFAKVLTTPQRYPADRRFGDGRAPLYPAPHWRQVVVESDNRLPAEGEDASDYSFPMDAAEVSVRLVHRRSFRSWRRADAAAEGDLLLAEQRIVLAP